MSIVANAQVEVRPITSADIPEVLRLLDLTGLTEDRLGAELNADSPYRWVCLPGPDGGLSAVHRGFVWGDHLVLKGVSVDEAARGGAAALQMAFWLRESARREGRRGIAAWVAAGASHSALLAGRLRLRQDGPWIHRYLVPLSVAATADGQMSAVEVHRDTPVSGSLSFGRAGGPDEPWITEDLLAPAAPAGRARRVHWVADRDRLCLSGLPCTIFDGLPALVAALAPLAGELGLTVLDLPIPAVDIPLALRLLALGARRLSRTCVTLARFEFSPTTRNAEPTP
ncbi:hypothetical protein LN042_35655 [Kitasatospora sp. RB6PN24]|uniref:hypothetical protein n=1 Tax=Kitasatospora humi TaxID=2893891 RepID=UPI001E5E12D1|nr:hypothetical protein [Kitasatospora humi]MCC9312334.1 hypothetical protein [Kitasatospora humi]